MAYVDRSLFRAITVFNFVCIIASVNSLDVAYVYYDSATTKYHITASEPAVWVAEGRFRNEMNKTGWAILDVRTNSKFNNTVQAYSAGLVEGYLTKTMIGQTWRNNHLNDFCPKPFSADCKKLYDFVKTTLDWLKTQVTNNAHTNDYWSQIQLFLIQTNGLTDGYKNIPTKPSLNVDPFGLWLLQVSGDMGAIKSALGINSLQLDAWKSSKILGSGSCSALIKLLPGARDVYVSQVTWNHYNSMLRILKKYEFGYHKMNAGLIPGHTIAFSSYPGFLFSLDDFYIQSSHMVIQETTIGNNNKDRWKYVEPQAVPEGVRVMVSNRLSLSGNQWVKTFSHHNSGTYNNEWMIVDYKKFTPKSYTPLRSGFFTLLNQVPGFIEYLDLSQLLYEQTYHASYNVPYFKSVYNISGWPKQAAKYGEFFTYENAPRAKIFRRDHSKVENMESMIKLMRYNDFKHDPLSVCKCTPPYSGENAIAARSDLNPANGTYILPVFGHRLHGATDVKVTSYSLSEGLEFYAQAGPTHDQQPPFRWSNLDPKDMVRHEGMPDLFEFETILVKWNK